jgi:hypothetical protein
MNLKPASREPALQQRWANGRSNLVFREADAELVGVAKKFGLNFTRYADDIVFSGNGEFPDEIKPIIRAAIESRGWKIAEAKERLAKRPNRLKVHGLLVHGEKPRLTKGYRNQIRAYKHLLAKNAIDQEDFAMVMAVRQIVSRAISSDKFIDIFDAAGLKKPDISILSDEFLAEVQHLPQRNLAVELLQKLLNNELKIRSKKYLVQSRSFAEMLEATIRRYQNRTIEAAQVIAELIELAKQMREGQKRGTELGLTDDEVAFYDALETNDSAVKVLGEPTLKNIARELVAHVRKSVTIDWTLRESAQAQIRVLVRRILRKYGYPPDKQEKATQTVLEQAKLLCADWAI